MKCRSVSLLATTLLLQEHSLSVGHKREPCENGWTDRDVIQGADQWGQRNHIFSRGPDPQSWKKVAHTRLQSVGFRSWYQFLAVSLQVAWVINPTVGCHYFPPGLLSPPQPLRGLLPFSCLVNRDAMGVNSLPKTVTRQHRGCNLNPSPSAPESSRLTTWLPSHPRGRGNFFGGWENLTVNQPITKHTEYLACSRHSES